MNTIKFRPLRGLVLIRRDIPTAERGGIVIPENVQTYGWRATVVRPGPDAIGYKAGDPIFFLKEHTVLPFPDRTLALTDTKYIPARLSVVEDAEVILPQNDYVLVLPDEYTPSSGEVVLSRNRNHICTGIILRFGVDCHDLIVNRKVWYAANQGVDCVENGRQVKLIKLDDILAIENNA